MWNLTLCMLGVCLCLVAPPSFLMRDLFFFVISVFFYGCMSAFQSQ